MKIAVIGTGYVGLVTGTCLAETGNEVICVDIDAEKVQKMRDGQVPIYEPHLEILFERNIKANRLRFTTQLQEGVDFAEIIFLALPTPENGDGAADLSYVLDVAKKIGVLLQSYKVIVDKSTVPVGTADEVRKLIAANTNCDFDVVSNPEFLREGFAVDDFMKPERIIIGSQSDRAIGLMQKLYKPYVRSGNPIIIMDERSAELTKYAANAFLATKITFMNEIANYCEKVGADIDKVRRGMGTDSRIGKRFLFPGIGYGGSCFPKDVKALHRSGDAEGYAFQLLDAVIRVNADQKLALIPKIKNFFKNQIKDKTFAIWGLAFKPETDDIREAPALDIINSLLALGANIQVFDPEAMNQVRKKIGNKITYSKNMYAALLHADALVVCTEWSLFRTPNFKTIKNNLKTPVIFDGRNVYDRNDLDAEGFCYFSIGRIPVVNQPSVCETASDFTS